MSSRSDWAILQDLTSKQSDLFTKGPRLTTNLDWNIKHLVHRSKNYMHNSLEADDTSATRDTITGMGRRKNSIDEEMTEMTT